MSIRWIIEGVGGIVRYALSYFIKPLNYGESDDREFPSEEPEAEELRPFYAVCLDTHEKLPDGEEPPFVFEKLPDVLAFCKLYKAHQPRWKQVNSYEEAVDFSFAEGSVEEAERTVSKSLESLPYPSLTPQQMVAFRKLIADGDLAAVRGLIESNPRYLVGSGDTPTILQEGCRYNAFHIAAKSNHRDILLYLIDCLRSEAFFDRLYPDVNNNRENRRRFLLDLYLNTPDKTRANETPLHFACKFGSFECAAVLLEQAECDRNARNGEGKLAQEIICSRGGTSSTADKIASLFEDLVIIPIITDEQNACTKIGAPVNVLTRDQDSSKVVDSPVRCADTPKKLSATLGPIKSPQAMEIMSDLLKTRFSPRDVEIRRRDPDKGVVTVARNVARRHNIPWSEEWDFLGTSVDLVSDKGLNSFEEYLRHMYGQGSSVGFIHGPNPTKTDYHVWTALSPVIDTGAVSKEFLKIGDWLSLMKSFKGDDMKTWRTPIKRNPNGKQRATSGDVDCLVNLMERFDVHEP